MSRNPPSGTELMQTSCLIDCRCFVEFFRNPLRNDPAMVSPLKLRINKQENHVLSIAITCLFQGLAICRSFCLRIGFRWNFCAMSFERFDVLTVTIWLENRHFQIYILWLSLFCFFLLKGARYWAEYGTYITIFTGRPCLGWRQKHKQLQHASLHFTMFGS